MRLVAHSLPSIAPPSPALKAGAARPTAHFESAIERDQILDVLCEAVRYYKRQLKESPAAIEYLKRRGVTGVTAAQWLLGYAPASWDGLRRHIKDDRLLLAAGLAKQSEESRIYDAFRGRLMFPIRDQSGEVVGFGGRLIVESDQALGPKYLNCAETAVFRKSEVLYGEHRITAQAQDLIIVEGYLDVVLASQAQAHQGILSDVNFAAPMGTALTVNHACAIDRFAKRIGLWYDNDPAGRTATMKAIQLLLRHTGTLDCDRRGRLADPDHLSRLQVVGNDAAAGEDPASILVSYPANGVGLCLESWVDYLYSWLCEQPELLQAPVSPTEGPQFKVSAVMRALREILLQGLSDEQRYEAGRPFEQIFGLRDGELLNMF